MGGGWWGWVVGVGEWTRQETRRGEGTWPRYLHSVHAATLPTQPPSQATERTVTPTHTVSLNQIFMIFSSADSRSWEVADVTPEAGPRWKRSALIGTCAPRHHTADHKDKGRLDDTHG